MSLELKGGHAQYCGIVHTEEIGYDTHLHYSHMTLVCNYDATRSKEFH